MIGPVLNPFFWSDDDPKDRYLPVLRWDASNETSLLREVTAEWAAWIILLIIFFIVVKSLSSH